MSVPGELFLWGRDVSHMKTGGVLPRLVVTPRGDRRIPLLSSGQHFDMARAFGELALPFFPPSPQLCHFGCKWNFLWVWLVPSLQPPWACGWSLRLRRLVGKEGKTHRAHMGGTCEKAEATPGLYRPTEDANPYPFSLQPHRHQGGPLGSTRNTCTGGANHPLTTAPHQAQLLHSSNFSRTWS